MKLLKTNIPLVSIVVLNWNGLEDTKVCLEELKKLDYPSYEIIVVDNGSTDGSKEYLNHLNDIIYVDNPKNRGFTGGHIDGLKHCSGEFIVLLNNDAVMKSDYLTIGLQHFSDPLVSAVGGRSYWWDDKYPLFDERSPFYSYQQIDLYSGEARMLTHDNGVPQEVNNVSGSCVIVRRTVIDEVGYLYDRFFAYFEETDLFARMKRAGYKVMFDPSLRIWHHNGGSSGSRSGSYFFYYQIFRNRFIFALRNFENRFLAHFLLIYARIAIGSWKRLLLRQGDPTMNRAYFQAALYNFAALPWTLFSRFLLWRQLGNSTYNHKIFLEQTGVSIVVDCTKVGRTALSNIIERVHTDTNPHHEYVLTVRALRSLPKLPPNARYIIDRKYFESLPINLGALAARFPWMLLCGADDIPSKAVIDNVVLNPGHRAELLAFGKRGVGRAGYIFLNKSLFERAGGVQGGQDIQSSLSWLVNYARLSRRLAWQPLPMGVKIVSCNKLGADEKKDIKYAASRDTSMQKKSKPSLFKLLQSRHYRLYQATTLTKWLLVWRIPIRLKLARIKNLAVFGGCLRIKSLALELKHMHNEVLLYGEHGSNLRQFTATRKKLSAALANPFDIPIFIICFERIEALRQLISWLEEHGLHKIVLIDNDSSYPPLVSFLRATHHQVLYLNRNVGHTAPWSLAIIRTLVPEDFYIVSDPDIIPIKDCPEDFLTHFLKLHQRFPEYQKVGFGLKIDDLPNSYTLKQSVIDWESQFWKYRLTSNVFEAGIDTTFALYKPYTYTYSLHPSLRTGEPYVARHLPWYVDPEVVSEEEKYYRFRMDPNVNSWNSDELPDRYAEEIG